MIQVPKTAIICRNNVRQYAASILAGGLLYLTLCLKDGILKAVVIQTLIPSAPADCVQQPLEGACAARQNKLPICH